MNENPKVFASLVSENDLCEEFIIPKSMDERVADVVGKAVGNAAIESGVAVLFQHPHLHG